MTKILIMSLWIYSIKLWNYQKMLILLQIVKKSQPLPEASESESAFDDYSQNFKVTCFQEYLKDEKYFNEYSIKKNSSASSNFLSSGDMEIVNLIPEEKCCNHNDREAVWTCKDNYSKKFCEICSENMGFKTQGKLI